MIQYELVRIVGTDPEKVEVLDDGGLEDLDRLYEVRDRLTVSSFANGPGSLTRERYAVRAK